MQNFRKLTVWAKAHELAIHAYRATAEFPRDERFELTRQIRKAAVSVPANIAEGCGRSTSRDMARFLDLSSGSACELEYYWILATDLELMDTRASTALLESTREIKMMLASLTQKLRTEN